MFSALWPTDKKKKVKKKRLATEAAEGRSLFCHFFSYSGRYHRQTVTSEQMNSLVSSAVEHWVGDLCQDKPFTGIIIMIIVFWGCVSFLNSLPLSFHSKNVVFHKTFHPISGLCMLLQLSESAPKEV